MNVRPKRNALRHRASGVQPAHKARTERINRGLSFGTVATMLVVLASLAMALAVSGSAATPRPVCHITGAKYVSSTGRLLGQGWCGYTVRQNGKLRRYTFTGRQWSFAATAFDRYGSACSLAKATGVTNNIKLVPGANKVRATLRLWLKKGKHNAASKAAVRTLVQTVGDDSAVCGTPSSVPIPTPPVLAPPALCTGDLCGQPAMPGGGPALPGACQWSTTITYDSGSRRVSAGRVVCPVGNCWLQPLGGVPAEWLSWLGSPVNRVEIRCSDGTAVELFLMSVTLTDSGPSHATCGPLSMRGRETNEFTVPASWGGTLAVKWLIATDAHGTTQGAEIEAASFTLGGTDNGCPQLTSDPNTIQGY